MPAHPPASSNTGSLNIATVEILPRSSNIATWNCSLSKARPWEKKSSSQAVVRPNI